MTYKNLRISLISLLLMLCGTVFAEDYTSTFTSKTWTVNEGESVWVASAEGTALDSQNERGVQFGKNKGSMTLTSADSFINVTKVVIVASSNGDEGTLNVSVGDTTLGEELIIEKGTANKNKDYVFEVNDATVSTSGNVIINIAEGDHSVWIKSITVTATGKEVVEKVATPVFSPNGGDFEESIDVTLSCTNQSATIMYAVASATALEWQVYEAPITLTETTMLVAKAVCDGMDESDMVRAQFTKVEPQPEPAGQVVTFDFNNDYAELFPSIKGTSSGSGNDYVADGDITEMTTSIDVNGVTVTVSPADEGKTANRIWSGDPRLRMYSGTLTFTSTGDNIKKIVFTQSTNKARVSDDNTCDSGELTKTDQQNNGTVTWTGDAKSVTITIAGNTQYSKAVVTVGDVMEQVAAPVFSPNGGEFEESVDVTLSCATEGATIMYAVASAPALEWQVYEAPINLTESTTLMAYAVRDGMQNSETVRAEFTKIEPVRTVTIAEFNAAEESTSVWYQLTGVIKNLEAGDQYGNFDIEDETGEVYVYGLLSEKGGEKKQFQQLVADKFIQNGSKLTLIGNRGSYKDKIEVMNAYFVAIDNSGVVEQPKEECDSIGAFIALESGKEAVLNFRAEDNVQVVFTNKAENGNEWVILQDTHKHRVVLYNMDLAEKLKANDNITGSLTGALKVYYGMNEMIKTAATDTSKVTNVAGTAIKVDGLANTTAAWDPYKILKLCKISKVTYYSENNHIYATDGSGKDLEIRDNFKVGYTLPELQEGQSLNITGIVVPYVNSSSNDTLYQISPISQEAIEVVYPPYYKEFAETTVFIPTAEALAEAMKPEAAWVEWGGQRTDNKTLHIDPETDEETTVKSAPGVGLKNGNSTKSFATLIQGVEAVWAYGASTGSSLRTLRVTATDESGESVTAQETTDGQTATIKVRGLDPSKRYRVVYTGFDGDGTSGSGADVVLHAVKFLPKDIADAIEGDVNNDGQVGIGDIIAITNFMASTDASLTLEQCDINGDGEVGIGDIIAITNIMAGAQGGTTEPAVGE